MNNAICKSSPIGLTPVIESGLSVARPSQGIRELIRQAADLLLEWAERARTRRHLTELDNRLLKDIGLTRADVEWEASKPFWKV